MYVCICQAVTERQIREAALRGALTLQDLRRELGVARECGLCASCARTCLRAFKAFQGCLHQAVQVAEHEAARIL